MTYTNKKMKLLIDILS